MAELKDVIQKEFEIIQIRRKREPVHPYQSDDDTSPVKHKAEADPARRCRTLIGLALSGGGIRSATTNIGVLQGLAERKVLSFVDYLSAVSGGGYIGACLASLLSNVEKNKQPVFTSQWEKFPFREDRLKYGKQDPADYSRKQMKHIRTGASYLAPRARHFSPDVMRALGAVFVSTFMTLLWFTLVIVLITSAYMTVVSWVAPELEIKSAGQVVSSISSKVKSDGSFSFSVAAEVKGEEFKARSNESRLAGDDLDRIGYLAKQPFAVFQEITRVKPWLLALQVIFLGVFISYFFSRWMCSSTDNDVGYDVCFCFLFLIAFAALTVGGGVLKFLQISEFAEGAILVVPPLFFCGALLGLWLLYLVKSKNVEEWNIARRSQFHRLAGMFIVVLLFTIIWVVLPGFMSIGTADYVALMMVVVGTALRFAVSSAQSGKEKKAKGFSLPAKYREWLLGVGVFVFLCLAVVYAGNLLSGLLFDGNWPGQMEGHDDSLAAVQTLLPVVIGVAVVLVVFHILVDVNKISPHYFYRDRLAEAFLKTEVEDTVFKHTNDIMKLADVHGNDENTGCAARGPYLLLNATLNLTASRDLKAFNRKSDIFTFSRLYVGSEKTGYLKTPDYNVDGDGIKLARAMAISGAAVTSVMGMNTSLAQSFACTIFGVRLGYWLPNLQSQKVLKIKKNIEKLKKDYKRRRQEIDIASRQIESDKIERLKKRTKLEADKYQIQDILWKICCQRRTVKRLKEEYLAGKDGFSRKVSRVWYGVFRIYKELIGHTAADSQEIYLSDGGHSGDNLGIIPLMRRQVKVLLVSDSECDPSHTFNSFNSSVRNAYVDEGVRVDINLNGLKKDGKGLTKDKFAVGRIFYPDQDEKQKNWLVLFKNTLNGEEISGIVNYKEKSEYFPHETTADQFFTEEQFESYRALGRFTIFDALGSEKLWLNGCSASDPNSSREVYHFLKKLMCTS